MLTKGFRLLICCALLSTFIHAQTVKTQKGTSRIKGENTDGVSVSLESTEQDVNTALSRYLKSYGKVKQVDGVFVLTDAVIGGSTYPNSIYGVSKASGSSSQAWLGIKPGEWKNGDADKLTTELEKMAYDFGVKFYRDKIQGQIDESLRALQAVEKQQQRLTTDSKNLASKLESNKREKVQLEKSLEDNKTENASLLQKIDQNKKAQDSVALAAEQIRKVVEMHKERQAKVN